MLRRHRLLAGIVLAGLLVRVAYVLATRDWALRGDEIEYAAEGRFFAAGHPWWSALPYRNHRVAGGFVPVSIQDSALYGTFNDDAAHDRTYPWAWRPVTRRDLDLFRRTQPLGDVALRSRLLQRARSYIADHPASLADAFFWNGLSRLWDVRRPARVLEDAQINGRSRPLAIALALHWILLPLALLGLWRARRRPALVWPLVALALAAAVVFSTAAATRYRVPFEPVIALLAASGVFTGWRRSADPPAPGARRAARG